MKFKALISVSAATLTVAAMSTPVLADITTFAAYSLVSVDNLYLKDGAAGSANLFASSNGTTAGPVAVYFSFENGNPILDAAVNHITANLTFTAPTSGNAVLFAGTYIQPLGAGGFSLRTTAPITVYHTTYATGSNLLTGTFSNSALVGKKGSTSAKINADNTTETGDSLFLTSDFLNIAPSADVDAAFQLTAITPKLIAAANSPLSDFRAASGGQFSSDPSPTAAAVPEPASWALMLAGFGLAGASLRRRQRLSAV